MALPTSAPPRDAQSLVAILRWRAERQPDRPAYTFLSDAVERPITYSGLDRRCRAIAAALQQHGAQGSRALLLLPQSLEYIAAFFGCLYARQIAVPAYPPNPSRLERSIGRVQAIVEDALPDVILTTSDHLSLEAALAPLLPPDHRPRWIAVDQLDDALAEQWRPAPIGGDQTAFLQYTSGSTSRPKGVIVSHANLIHNSAYLESGWQSSEQSVMVTWLPMFHDMGLIYGIMQPLYRGFACYVMAPAAFLQRPSRWLQAIARYRGTHSAAPNFAFELCVQRVSPEQRATLDLSSWQVVINGAEPIRAHTLERFIEAFGPCGFQRTAFYPGYGLAEATLKVTCTPEGAGPSYRAVRAADLEQGRVALAAPGDSDSRTLVSCGSTGADVGLVVADPQTCLPTPPDTVGEIWVSGPSVAQGYWNKPEESARTFDARLADTGEGPFLRTGDLGFVHDGQLYITGRLKDMIIIGGRNIYPQDIELSVEQSHPAFRPHACAAFSVEVANEERLVVVVEVDQHYRPGVPGAAASGLSNRHTVDTDLLIRAIRRAVAEDHDVQVYDVALLKAGSLAKTSSGKIQRHACRHNYLTGQQNLWNV